MKQFSLAFLLFALVLTSLSFRKHPSQGNKPLQHEQLHKNVPFKGTYTTTVQVLHGPPLLQQRITGNGQATHLGESNFVALATVTLTPPPPFVVSGTTVFTAANGDEFYTEFSGTSTPIGNGRSSVIVTHEVTGGTGRFENAGGAFTGTTIADPSQPTGTISYIGTISY